MNIKIEKIYIPKFIKTNSFMHHVGYMLNIVKDLREANCITHSGKFHADEVMATVILEK